MNKVTRWVVAAIAVFAIVVVVCAVSLPKSFDWAATHLHTSRQPFGAEAMDSVLAASVDAGYSVARASLSDVAANDAYAHSNVLVVAQDFQPTEDDFAAIDTILASGRDVMLVMSDMNEDYDYYDYVDPDDVSDDIVVEDEADDEEADYWEDLVLAVRSLPDKGQLAEDLTFDEMAIVTWPEDEHYDSARYRVAPSLVASVVLAPPRWRILATVNIEDTWRQDEFYYNEEWINDTEWTVLAATEVGEGTLYVCSLSYLFTNYGILDPQLSPLVMRILSLPGTERPIVRVDLYGLPVPVDDEFEEAHVSVLTYFLEHRPLRWATYTLLALIAVGMIFSARRRQRVIPVVKRPANMMLDMVQHYGRLFYSRHDNGNLLFKKYCMFGVQLFRAFMVDIDNLETEDEAVATLARVTGRDRARLSQDLRDLREQACSDAPVSDKATKRAIQLMNDILQDAGLREEKTKNNDVK